jgi:hypothetical protein
MEDEPSEPYFKDEREFRYVPSCQASVGGASDDRLNTWTALPWSSFDSTGVYVAPRREDINYCDLVTDNGAEYSAAVLGQATTLDWIDKPVEAPASLAKQGIPTRINAPGTVMSDDTDQLLNSALDKYYLVDTDPTNRLFLDQIHEGVVDLSVREGSGTDPELVNEKAFSKCWQDCMDTDSCDFVKYNTGSSDAGSRRQAPGTTGGPFQYVPGICTQYKLADAVNLGHTASRNPSYTQTEKYLLAINSPETTWGDRDFSRTIIEPKYDDYGNGYMYNTVLVEAPELDNALHTGTTTRTWNVSGAYLQQNSADFDNETPGSTNAGAEYTNIDMDSMSRGTASSRATAPDAVVTLGGLETRFGTQNFKLSSGNTFQPTVPEERPYWKKTGGPGTPDLFLFYANSNRWLISTKLTALWTTDAAGDGIVPGDNFISSPDGFVVASVTGRNLTPNPEEPIARLGYTTAWPPMETGWKTYLTGAPVSSTITTSVHSKSSFTQPSPVNDVPGSPQEKRKNTMLKILGLEEAAGSSGWPATSPTTKGLTFVDGLSGGADNEKWISMNKISN